MTMSANLYATCLFWHYPKGEARQDGLTWKLDACPVGICAHVAELRYAPAVRLYEIRQSAGEWRDMTLVERLSVQSYLHHCAAAMHKAMEEWTL